MLGMKRKGGALTNFQISREDSYPKLCVIRNLCTFTVVFV